MTKQYNFRAENKSISKRGISFSTVKGFALCHATYIRYILTLSGQLTQTPLAHYVLLR
jgi:hypothetical protein